MCNMIIFWPDKRTILCTYNLCTGPPFLSFCTVHKRSYFCTKSAFSWVHLLVFLTVTKDYYYPCEWSVLNHADSNGRCRAWTYMLCPFIVEYCSLSSAITLHLLRYHPFLPYLVSNLYWWYACQTNSSMDLHTRDPWAIFSTSLWTRYSTDRKEKKLQPRRHATNYLGSWHSVMNHASFCWCMQLS
jgi:hypothetical protein